ncbi:MAG: PDZ domain-containing protein [Thaumarchaeota archaeon]|nr:PDZ domain-containing protein [Nitrososphaerota archaeon]
METEISKKKPIVYTVTIITLIAISGFLAGFTLNLNNQIQNLSNEVKSLSIETKSLQTIIENIQKKIVDIQNIAPNLSLPAQSLPDRRLSDGLDFSILYQSVKESVVQVVVGNGGGSGFVYNSTHIVTNYHVVQSITDVEIILHDGESLNGKVVGKDQYSDLAVISITLPEGIRLKPLTIGDSTKLKVGERVVAVGTPFGLTGSITQGIVSQMGRLLQAPGTQYSIPNVIQVDAPINPGNSGGVLLNLNGELVGVTSAGITTSGVSGGVGLVIPSSTVKRIIPALLTTGTYKHPFIGIVGMDITLTIAQANKLNTTKGVIIVETMAGSPAQKAGIKGSILNNGLPIGGDVIVAVDGNIVRKIDDVISYSEEFKKPGDLIKITLLREGRKIDINIVLGERPLPN